MRVRSSLQAFWEKHRFLSVLLPQHKTALILRGNVSVKFWLLRQKLPAHIATVQGEEQGSSTDCIWEDTTALFEPCRSTDTNLIFGSITKCEDMGCAPGTTPEYLSLLQTHKTQKPSVSQGLYPILLLALLASTTSPYSSLGVTQDSNPQRQLLKALVYYSATSAGILSLYKLP
jgi:hypothetical protein